MLAWMIPCHFPSLFFKKKIVILSSSYYEFIICLSLIWQYFLNLMSVSSPTTNWIETFCIYKFLSGGIIINDCQFTKWENIPRFSHNKKIKKPYQYFTNLIYYHKILSLTFLYGNVAYNLWVGTQNVIKLP